MPKIDVTRPIVGFDNSPLTRQKEDVEFCEECSKKWQAAREPFTLRMACTRSLTALTEETRKLSGEKKFERGQLAQRIYSEDEPHLTAEEIATLKKLIGENESVVIVLRAFEMLDPPEES